MSTYVKQDIKIEEYYVRYGPLVLRRCRQLLKDEQQALDSMQEVFAKLLLYQNRLDDRYPSALLFRMATNICLNLIRDRSKDAAASGEDVLASIAAYDDNEVRTMFRDRLDRIFRGEKDSTRVIAVLYFIDGMTLEEVAAEVGLSLSGVRRRLQKLKMRVRSLREIHHEL